MIARDSTSYPYLAVAQHYCVDYGMVLKFADDIEKYPLMRIRDHWHPWAEAAYDAWAREQARRKRARQP